MSGATSGPGFLIQVSPYTGSYAGNTYTTIAEAREIKGPEQTVATKDVTNQSSPSNYREWIPTLIDGGSVTFPANLLPADATQAGLLADLQARTLMDWQLVIGSTGLSMFFSAFVTKWGNTYPVEDVAMLDIELKITGPVVGPTTSV